MKINSNISGISTKTKEKLKGKKVLILGGLGMIGSNLAHKLVENNAEVTIADACIEPFGANIFNLNGINDKVILNKTDIRDSESIKLLVKDKEIIFNLAGQISHNDSIKDPLYDAELNYMGQLSVMENIRIFNPKAKVLFSGSRLQFGRIQQIPVNEKQPSNPETPYALHKSAAERMYQYYYKIHNISTVVFRIANPYGMRGQIRHHKYSIINYFIRKAMEDSTIKIFGDGKQIRDYIYIEDLVNAFIIAATSNNTNGEIYNVGSGVATTFLNMVKTVLNTVGMGKFEHIPWPDSYLNVETGDYVTDISKISTTLEWEPRMTLQQGIERTFQYYKKNIKYYLP